MDVAAAFVWVQSLSVSQKAIVTGIVWIMAAALTYCVWQKPTEVDPPNAATTSIAAKNTISQGQTGGINAGVYINQVPPVTDQQKAEAISGLQSELGELADFPNGPDLPVPPSALQSMLVDKAPHRLYIVLGKYYRQTIMDVPVSGQLLYEYKVKYYDFENAEQKLEQDVMSQVPKIIDEKGMTKVRMPQIWQATLIYFIQRSTRMSQDDIKNGGLTTIEISYDQQETIFQELTQDPKFGPAMVGLLKKEESLRQEAHAILSKFAHR